MKKFFSMMILATFVFGVSFANFENVSENNFEQNYLASDAEKEKMLDDKLRKQAEKKRAEQLEKKAKAG
ncbi:MAG: hypothetical protein IK062_04555 [Selenomonadaceae bacterium]|nr:hypothetical protein [Selenomonadaceae bacterium]